MQRLSAKGMQGGLGLRAQPARLALKAGGVGLVAQDRVPDMREMHADLVGAAGLQRARQQAGHRLAVGAGETLQHLPMGDGMAAAGAHGAPFHYSIPLWCGGSLSPGTSSCIRTLQPASL